MPRREPLTEPPAPALTELTALQREQAMGRFAVLKPHLEQGVPLSRSADCRRCTAAHGGAVARQISPRRIGRPRTGAARRSRSRQSGRQGGRDDRRPLSGQTSAIGCHHSQAPFESGEGTALDGTVLRQHLSDRPPPRSRNGDARARGPRGIPRPVRASPSIPRREAQCDLAGRPYATRPEHP